MTAIERFLADRLPPGHPLRRLMPGAPAPPRRAELRGSVRLCARTTRESLPLKGYDFSQTDITPA